MRRLSLVSAALCFALLASAPGSAQLGPKRASDLVNLRLESGPCLENAGWSAFSTRALTGGQQVAFQIPKGKVLVVRRVEVQVQAGVSEAVSVSVLGGLPGSAYSYANRLLVATGSTDIEIVFPVGFAVPEGGSVCVSSSVAGATGKLDGHFAPAK